jgi:ribonuclease HII
MSAGEESNGRWIGGEPSRGRPLAALRAAYSSCRSDLDLDALRAALEDDPRAGARELLDRIASRRDAVHRERVRLSGLLALRDELAARGVHGIAGVDEVGVGPLAGPVVAAAVVLPMQVELVGLDDSKRVPPARRASLAREIRETALGIGLGEVGVEEIDQMGIYRAALEAMRRAVASLARVCPVGHLLVDARTVPGFDGPQTAIIKGDSKDASIAAASIVAKVHRDAWMERLGERHPAYGFERHMGYGTAEHVAALERHGPCPVHRRSFAPVALAERRFALRSGASA